MSHYIATLSLSYGKKDREHGAEHKLASLKKSFPELHSKNNIIYSVGKSISFVLALNGASASGRWDWSPRISWFLDRIPCFQKKKKKNNIIDP